MALKGLCGTGMFASAATHADSLIHFRNNQFTTGGIQVENHVHRFGGTVFRAGPAVGVVRINHTVFPDKFGQGPPVSVVFLQLSGGRMAPVGQIFEQTVQS